MVRPRTDDSSQLEEPLLADHLGHFIHPSLSPIRPHTVDVDPGITDSISPEQNRGERDKSLESQRSFLFGSRSGRWRSPSVNGNEDAAAGKDKEKKRSQRKRRLRNPIKNKSFVKRAAHSAANEPAYFLKNLVYGIVLWPKWAWNAMTAQKGLTVLSLKSGVAAGLASIITVLSLPAPYTGLSAISIWAVVTIDILSEANIGLSLSKGVNRVAGTFSAGALAVILTQLGPDIPDSIYPYYVVFWVTFGGFVFRFLKGIPPLKDQWGYAFTVATIAFHILLLTTYLQPERVTLPLLRFCMILAGFFLWSLVNLAFQPVFAGDTLHKLVAKNFDTAADVLLRCVTEYSNFRMLDHVPDILCGRSEDDKIHQTYHEIVMSDSDVDKLLTAVTWEPCHGPFFMGYPWHLYDDITDYLRYTLYDIIALDSCLRASIQAPKHLRDIFSEEMMVIAAECSKVLHTLADCMRNMCKFSREDVLCQAEEAALALQNKIYMHTHQLLVPGNEDQEEDHSKVNQNRSRLNNSSEQFDRSYENGKGSNKSSGKNFRVVENDVSGTRFRDQSAPVPIPHQQGINYPGGSLGRSVVQSNGSYSSKEIQGTVSLASVPVCSGSSESLPRHHQKQVSSDTNDDGKNVISGKERYPHSLSEPRHHQKQVSDTNDDGRNVISGKERYPHSLSEHSLRADTVPKLFEKAEENIAAFDKPPSGWKQHFMQRRSSLGHNFEGSLERISALSLVKFASLLIEVVAKMQFVVGSVDELSLAARFNETITNED